MRGRFAYYERLSPEHKRVYRESDAHGAIALPDAAALRPLAAAIERALAEESRAKVAKACNALTSAMCAQLGVGAPKVRVRLVRPSDETAELHGLYTFPLDGSEPTIEVWMRTAAQAKVVRFRTFLRTLAHEIVHHLDVVLLELGESFHTAGFFRRESSLVAQLVAPPPEKRAAKPQAEQLGLFGATPQPPRASKGR